MPQPLFSNSTRLASDCHFHFCCESGSELAVSASLAELLSRHSGARRIDATSLIQIINRMYCFGDRTLLQGVARTPWRAVPNEQRNGWIFECLPPHGRAVRGIEEIAGELFARLRSEVAEFCQGKSCVGILLSGGMDSRIVAAALKQLQDSRSVSCRVVAMTWGQSESRDVVYAQKIAKLFDWEFRHFPIGPENLVENITAAAERGAEYSPVHLHAMLRVRDTPGIDGVIAASYGDSVGRAEFSGSHVSRLKPLDRHVHNRFMFLYSDVFAGAVGDVGSAIEQYHQRYPRADRISQLEVDHQAHYMRRLIQGSMSVIAEKIPLLQAFTSPEVFGYVWSLDLGVRDNRVYRSILENFGKQLLEIPWARTGEAYLAGSGAPDQYARIHHRYGHWIRNDLQDLIRQKVLSPELERLNVFNMDALQSLLAVNRISHAQDAQFLDRHLIWIAAVADFARLYSVEGIVRDSRPVKDRVDAHLLSVAHVIGFKSKLGLNGGLKKFRDIREKKSPLHP